MNPNNRRDENSCAARKQRGLAVYGWNYLCKLHNTGDDIDFYGDGDGDDLRSRYNLFWMVDYYLFACIVVLLGAQAS